jgi:hypothetical protein
VLPRRSRERSPDGGKRLSRRVPTRGERFGAAVEVEIADPPDDRLDQDVGRRVLQAEADDLLLDDLRGSLDDRAKARRTAGPERPPERTSPVNRDLDDRSPESFSRDVGRQGFDVTAVDKKPPALADRREQAGNGDARAHG